MNTTYDLYRAFLDGIRKGGNFSITVAQFNRLINDWGQDEWINKKVLFADLDQELIDKLAPLKVITDGEFMFSKSIDGSNPYVLPSIKNNKIVTPTRLPSLNHYFGYPKMISSNSFESINGIDYPPYMRLQNVEFRVNYLKGNKCDLKGLSGWIGADILRSDTEVPNKRSPFRKPSENMFYYEFLRNSIKLIHGEFVEGYDMKLKYFKYPRRIFLNEESLNPTDEQTGEPDYSGTTKKSINCELHYPQRKEIVNTAVRIFLERVEDIRYKSYLNELNIINNGKS